MKTRLTSVLLLTSLAVSLLPSSVSAQRQMEKLGRGVVALHSATSQAYIGWRLLATDPSDIGFNIYRSANGAAGVKLNAVCSHQHHRLPRHHRELHDLECLVCPSGDQRRRASAQRHLRFAANSPVRQYLSIPLQPVFGGASPPYDVKFAWFGDFDGDGEYDYLLDRLSTNGGNVKQYLHAYKRDGTFLWQTGHGIQQHEHLRTPTNLTPPPSASATRTTSRFTTSTATAKRKSSSARPTARSSPTARCNPS
jgi:hypothetical protein